MGMKQVFQRDKKVKLWLLQVFYLVKCPKRIFRVVAFSHSMLPISMQTYVCYTCLSVCMCVKLKQVSDLFCVHVHTPQVNCECAQKREKCVCAFYVWVCVSLIFPGLHSRVALGTKSPGCNTLIVELFTLYTNPLHPHFGMVPLPLA